MHIPKKFKQEKRESLLALIQNYPFATLIVHGKDGIDAMHLPLLLKQESESLMLQGHIAKVNSFWQNLTAPCDTLVVFQGPSAYVSPNYYPSKKSDPKVVPTWNYVVVHVKGRIQFNHDSQWILNHLKALTAEHESTFDTPWSTEDAPTDFIQKQLPAIVGLEIEVRSLEGKWKLSQNKSAHDYEGVVRGLSAQTALGDQGLACMMRNIKPM